MPRWPAENGWLKMQSIVCHSDGSKTVMHVLEGVDTNGAPVDMMPCEGSAAQWVQDYEPFFEKQI